MSHKKHTQFGDTKLCSKGPLLVLPGLHVAQETNIANGLGQHEKRDFSNYNQRPVGWVNLIISILFGRKRTWVNQNQPTKPPTQTTSKLSGQWEYRSRYGTKRTRKRRFGPL